MYIIQEIQTNGDQTILAPAVQHADRASAESAFYTLCGYAVISQVEKHTIMTFTEEGFAIKELTKCFKHAPAPAPEPEPEPEGDGE